jgi:hypothetical protein
MWEKNMLRKIFGPGKENGVWRISTIQELMNMYGEPMLSQILEKQD